MALETILRAVLECVRTANATSESAKLKAVCCTFGSVLRFIKMAFQSVVALYVFVMLKQRAVVDKPANSRMHSGRGYIGEGKIDREGCYC